MNHQVRIPTYREKEKDFRPVLLARLQRLHPGDKFKVVNGDGTVFVVQSKVHDSIHISAITDVGVAAYAQLPKWPDAYVELVTPVALEIYVVYESYSPTLPAEIVSCHLTKAEAYKAVFKHRNDYWHWYRDRSIGNFLKTLNIDLGRHKRKWFVKSLDLLTGER